MLVGAFVYVCGEQKTALGVVSQLAPSFCFCFLRQPLLLAWNSKQARLAANEPQGSSWFHFPGARITNGCHNTWLFCLFFQIKWLLDIHFTTGLSSKLLLFTYSSLHSSMNISASLSHASQGLCVQISQWIRRALPRMVLVYLDEVHQILYMNKVENFYSC